MASGELAVHEDVGLVVDAAEVQYHATPFPRRRNRNASLIPDAAHEVGVPYARKTALRTKGDLYLSGEAFGILEVPFKTGFAMVDLEGPTPVKIQPGFAFELGTRMFGTWNGIAHGLLS
jgi:hypothetical protein